jgi:sugar/nucleoside kinase (ribokinase family)
MSLCKKVLGAGSPIVDLLVNVDDSFLASIDAEKGGMVLVGSSQMESLLKQTPEQPVKAPGGSAGNTIFGLAKLGVNAAMLGKLGKDQDGEFYRAKLQELGGVTDSFRYADGIHTARCLSMITPDSERTMRTDLGAAALMGTDDVSEADFENIDHVHIEGYLLFVGDLAEKVLATAKKCNCTVSLDLASFEVVRAKMDVLPELLEKYVDLVFANEDEAAAFCGDKSAVEQAEELGKLCEVSVVKLGKKGCCIKGTEGIINVTTTPVEAVDTTAAGDLWATGFLFGWLNGASLAECGKFGSITGAEVVKVIGSQIPEERWNYIKQELKAN